MYELKRPLNCPMFLLIPSVKIVKGVETKVFPKMGDLIFCSFRTFGGTEKTINDMIMVEDTAVIETYFRPDISSDCILKSASGKAYEILGTPENIDMMNKYLKFKVRAVKGGA